MQSISNSKNRRHRFILSSCALFTISSFSDIYIFNTISRWLLQFCGPFLLDEVVAVDISFRCPWAGCPRFAVRVVVHLKWIRMSKINSWTVKTIHTWSTFSRERSADSYRKKYTNTAPARLHARITRTGFNTIPLAKIWRKHYLRRRTHTWNE